MSAALRLYEQLTEAENDKTRARLIAEAFDELDARFPRLTDLATQESVRDSELRLQKEIKEVEGRLKLEIAEVEGRLKLEIAEVEGRLKLEIAEVEGRLCKEIEQTRVEIKALEVRLTRSIHRQTLWLVGAVGAIVGLIRLLDVVFQ
jgi:hypothetical protein